MADVHADTVCMYDIVQDLTDYSMPLSVVPVVFLNDTVMSTFLRRVTTCTHENEEEFHIGNRKSL